MPTAPAVRKPNRSGVPIHFYAPPELREALDACAADNRRTMTAEAMIALENHLQALGYWPAKQAE